MPPLRNTYKPCCTLACGPKESPGGQRTCKKYEPLFYSQHINFFSGVGFIFVMIMIK